MDTHCTAEGQPTGSDNSGTIGFRDTMTLVYERHGGVRELIEARGNVGVSRIERSLIDCAILFKCYERLGRPAYIRNRIIQVWESIHETCT